jgi:N-acetyl-anhydromuramyl-L-alanine amidase AmpD
MMIRSLVVSSLLLAGCLGGPPAPGSSDESPVAPAPGGAVMPPASSGSKADSPQNPDSLGGMYPPTGWAAASASNYTVGREGETIKFVVIHDMEGTYESAISWFENPAAQASAHYCIRSSDGEITQMVKEGDTAWHAGNWSVNTQAIGIEHEGYAAQPETWYTDAMYRQSAKLTAAICHRYDIPLDRDHIFGHAEVPDPNNPGQFGGSGHHTDPGTGWDWDKYMALVKSYY